VSFFFFAASYTTERQFNSHLLPVMFTASLSNQT